MPTPKPICANAPRTSKQSYSPIANERCSEGSKLSALPEQYVKRHNIVAVELYKVAVNLCMVLALFSRVLTDEEEHFIYGLSSTSKSQTRVFQTFNSLVELCLFDNYPRCGIM